MHNFTYSVLVEAIQHSVWFFWVTSHYRYMAELQRPMSWFYRNALLCVTSNGCTQSLAGPNTGTRYWYMVLYGGSPYLSLSEIFLSSVWQLGLSRVLGCLHHRVRARRDRNTRDRDVWMAQMGESRFSLQPHGALGYWMLYMWLCTLST